MARLLLHCILVNGQNAPKGRITYETTYKRFRSTQQVFSSAALPRRPSGRCQTTKDDMAKHAVRVAVRNVVKVVAVPPRPAAPRPVGRVAEPAEASGRPELLCGVSWDDSRRVWLVRPTSLPVRA